MMYYITGLTLKLLSLIFIVETSSNTENFDVRLLCYAIATIIFIVGDILENNPEV